MRKWLAELRGNMTKREVSRKMKISESYYNLIEKGERQSEMDLITAEKLSLALNVPLNKIIKEELKYKKGA